MGVSGQQHAPAALFPRERHCTDFTGGWVGPRAGLDGCGKSRPRGFRSPYRQARSESLYRLSYRAPQPWILAIRIKKCNKITTFIACGGFVFYRKQRAFSVDKKNQLDVTFCILYFSSTSCSTCFRQPCAHHQELTTA